jgi:hypothetical protein
MTDDSRPVHVKKETRWLFKVRYFFPLSDAAEARGLTVKAASPVLIQPHGGRGPGVPAPSAQTVQSVGTTHCQLPSSPHMATTGSSKMLITTYQTARCHVSGDNNLKFVLRQSLQATYLFMGHFTALLVSQATQRQMVG